jgi:hypothetical protein
MTARRPKTKLAILAGVMLAATAFLARGLVPELVRYVRIRRM